MKYAVFSILLLFVTFGACAQQRFEKDIRAFKEKDKVERPPEKPILFIGSSSFTRWEKVQQDFPGYVVLNRGFGGSTLEDVILYQDDIIFPYSPRQIVIYCGENDIASGASADDVLARFDKLFTSIRSKLPDVPVVYISMKPSPSREKFRSELERGNALIRDYLSQKKNTQYVDVFSEMLNGRNKPSPELYVSDSLHMSDAGYAIWQRAIQPTLQK